jgi:hypothetical protein
MLGARFLVKKSKKFGAFSTRPEGRAPTVIYIKMQVAFQPTGKPRPERNPGYRGFAPLP